MLHNRSRRKPPRVIEVLTSARERRRRTRTQPIEWKIIDIDLRRATFAGQRLLDRLGQRGPFAQTLMQSRSLVAAGENRRSRISCPRDADRARRGNDGAGVTAILEQQQMQDSGSSTRQSRTSPRAR